MSPWMLPCAALIVIAWLIAITVLVLIPGPKDEERNDDSDESNDTRGAD